MDDHRRLAVPALDELDQLLHVLVAGMGVAIDLAGDVIHAENEMVLGGDRGRPLHQMMIAQEGDDVARAGLIDGVMQPRQRADVDHGNPSRITAMI